MLAVVKGLPLSYNRDLQEDKPPVFAARRDVMATAEALAALVRELTFEHARLEMAAADPLLRATAAAEQLVAGGMAFRDAHEHVAAEVREGTFVPPAALQPPITPGPASVREAVVAAKRRLL